MPRRACIDAPGALLHIVIRGIECKAILNDETDQEDSVERSLDGIRLSSHERILASSEFVEPTLKHAGEVYEHRMRMQLAGIDLSAVIAAAFHYIGIEE